MNKKAAFQIGFLYYRFSGVAFGGYHNGRCNPDLPYRWINKQLYQIADRL
jgi:hypothetical protein